MSKTNVEIDLDSLFTFNFSCQFESLKEMIRWLISQNKDVEREMLELKQQNLEQAEELLQYLFNQFPKSIQREHDGIE